MVASGRMCAKVTKVMRKTGLQRTSAPPSSHALSHAGNPDGKQDSSRSCISMSIFRWDPTRGPGRESEYRHRSPGRLGDGDGGLVFLRNRTGRTHGSTLVSELRRQAGHGKNAAATAQWDACHRAGNGTPAESRIKGPRNIDIDILLFGRFDDRGQGSDHSASRLASAPLCAGTTCRNCAGGAASGIASAPCGS